MSRRTSTSSLAPSKSAQPRNRAKSSRQALSLADGLKQQRKFVNQKKKVAQKQQRMLKIYLQKAKDEIPSGFFKGKSLEECFERQTILLRAFQLQDLQKTRTHAKKVIQTTCVKTKAGFLEVYKNVRKPITRMIANWGFGNLGEHDFMLTIGSFPSRDFDCLIIFCNEYVLKDDSIPFISQCKENPELLNSIAKKCKKSFTESWRQFLDGLVKGETQEDHPSLQSACLSTKEELSVKIYAIGEDLSDHELYARFEEELMIKLGMRNRLRVFAVKFGIRETNKMEPMMGRIIESFCTFKRKADVTYIGWKSHAKDLRTALEQIRLSQLSMGGITQIASQDFGDEEEAASLMDWSNEDQDEDDFFETLFGSEERAAEEAKRKSEERDQREKEEKKKRDEERLRKLKEAEASKQKRIRQTKDSAKRPAVAKKKTVAKRKISDQEKSPMTYAGAHSLVKKAGLWSDSSVEKIKESLKARPNILTKLGNQDPQNPLWVDFFVGKVVAIANELSVQPSPKKKLKKTKRQCFVKIPVVPDLEEF